MKIMLFSENHIANTGWSKNAS